MDIYLKRYARELHGKRPIRNFINNSPLLVELEQPLAEAAQHVGENMQFPLTEDFIVTRHGKYLGVGFAMDLLKAVEQQMRANMEELERAYSQLKSSQLALVQSEKMASLGQMVAGVAHGINTLQKRQAVAPISDPQEKMQAGNFLGILGRLRARISA